MLYLQKVIILVQNTTILFLLDYTNFKKKLFLLTFRCIFIVLFKPVYKVLITLMNKISFKENWF